jgi:putative ABC transport system permease protein
MPDWRYAIERRLEGLRLPPERETEVVEELSQHLDDRYEELRSGGASEDAARRDALSEVDEADLLRGLAGIAPPASEPLALGGGPTASAFGGLWQDLRFGARLLVKDAGASIVIVITLGLAIAANAVVFGLTDLVLLRPLPIGNEARLVTIYGLDRRQTEDRQRVSIPDYLEIKAQATTCEDTLAMKLGQVSLIGTKDALAANAAYATANLFHLWAVRPSVGRLFVPGEDAPGRDGVAVLAHHFWIAHFAGDPSVVGSAVTLNGRHYTVVGVVTPDIEIGNLGTIDVWVPLETNAAAARDDRSLVVMGLMKPGASLAGVNAELATIGDRLQQAYPGTNTGFALHAMSLRDSTVGRSTFLILTLLAVVVALVLLVACANVGTVMLARASARRREIAVRIALGATRWRLVRQLVSEGVLLGLASGALGLVLAYAGLTAFKTLSTETFFQRLAINGNLLTFAFLLSVLAPVLFGVLPALQSSRPNLNEDLKDGGRDAGSAVGGNRSRTVLVVAQVAFSLSVLIVSGLIVRSVMGIERVPLGIDANNVLTLRVRFDPPKYDDDRVRFRAVESILDRLTAIPGVTAAAAMRSFPVIEPDPQRQFAIVGRPAARPGEAPWAVEAAVFGDYGRAIGLPLLEGRTWQPGDRASSWAVALVNREAVRRYWPSRSPLGERITMLDAKGQADGAPIEIVGVVDNVIGAELTEPPPPRIYRPLPTRALTGVAFMVRAPGDVAALAPALRAALRAEDRDLAVSDVRMARTQVDNAMRTYDLIMAMFVGFAAIGLIVAVTGVYGVTAFSVGQRRHEIGVRMALGATAGDVLRLIAGRSFRLIGVGAALGIAGGWAIGLAMRNLLFGVGATDPATYAAVLTLVALCGFVATYLPAHRAMSIDPMAVLKRE